jgi:hypothetical protein
MTKEYYIVRQIIYNHLHKGTRKNGSRMSDRTDELHEGIISEISKQVDNFDEKYIVEYESRIPCAYGNKFTVDVKISDRITGNIHTVILGKAFVSSVQKNRANNANTSLGEIFRVLGINPEINIFFVTYIGNEIPMYSRGVCKRMESKNVSYIDLEKVISDSVLYSDEVKSRIHFGTISYDVRGVDYTTKESFHDTLKLESIQNTNTESFNKSVGIIFA